MGIGKEFINSIEKNETNSEGIVKFLGEFKIHLEAQGTYNLAADPIGRVINIYDSLYEGLEYSTAAQIKHERRFRSIIKAIKQSIDEESNTFEFAKYQNEISVFIENYQSIEKYVPGSFWKKLNAAIKNSLDFPSDLSE